MIIHVICLFLPLAAGPVVKLNHETLTLKLKDKLALEATIDGLPKPTVEWKFNGVDVTQDENVILENKKDKYILKLKKLDESYTGIFSVVATNDVGQSEASCKLIVEYPPRFTKELAGMKCLEDSPFDADIQVIGVPEPKLEWFKDDKPLTVSENVQLKGDLKLHIEKFQIANAGKYRAVATNLCGVAKTDATIEVLGKLSLAHYPNCLRYSHACFLNSDS